MKKPDAQPPAAATAAPLQKKSLVVISTPVFDNAQVSAVAVDQGGATVSASLSSDNSSMNVPLGDVELRFKDTGRDWSATCRVRVEESSTKVKFTQTPAGCTVK